MTFVDLFNTRYLLGVSQFAVYIHREQDKQAKYKPADAELVIILEDFGDNNYAYGYYFATWAKRRVFWLEDVQYEFVTKQHRICLTESHIGA